MRGRGPSLNFDVLVAGVALGLAWAGPASGADVLQMLDSRSPVEDTDGNGKPDLWREFAPDGRLLEFRSDTDGDGRPDLTIRFEAGRHVTLEDVDRDGRPDWRTTERLDESGQAVESRVTEEREGGSWRTVETRTLKRAGGTRVKDLYEIRRTHSDGTQEVSHEPTEVR